MIGNYGGNSRFTKIVSVKVYIVNFKCFGVDGPDYANHSFACFNPKQRIMVEGYCAKCKTRREIAHGVEEAMNSGRVVYKGVCATCGEEVVKIISEDDAEQLGKKLSGSLAG